MSCGLEVKSIGGTVELEEYCSVYMDDTEGRDSFNADDVYSLLERKEQDLLLAAELGKALLDKNEELSHQNEQLAEEYTSKIEHLTQEKYELKLQLEGKESEYENTIKELHADVMLLRQQLNEETQAGRCGNRERAAWTEEMTKQNERLTEQLKKSSHYEEQLQLQLQQLRQQMNNKRTTVHEHVHQLEVLREEIILLTERKSDLEKRIGSLTEDRDSLSLNLEDTQDRVVMLEKQNKEQEQRIRHQENEIQQIQMENIELQEKIDAFSAVNNTNSICDQNSSLFDELEMSNGLDDVLSMEITKQTSRPSSVSVGSSSAMNIDDDVEYGERELLRTLIPNRSDLMLHSPDSYHDGCKQLKQEMVYAYKQLNSLCQHLRGDITVHSEETDDIADDSLFLVISDLKDLIRELESRSQTNSPQGSYGEDNHSYTTSDMSQLRDELSIKDTMLENKSEELSKLIEKMSLHHEEMLELRKERDALQDHADPSLSKDDIVAQARKERDNAIASENKMEVELARVKLEHMSLNSQLMEAVKQKVKLSQQVELWQDDMQDLIESQVQERLNRTHETNNSDVSSASSQDSPKSRRFSFWK